MPDDPSCTPPPRFGFCYGEGDKPNRFIGDALFGMARWETKFTGVGDGRWTDWVSVRWCSDCNEGVHTHCGSLHMSYPAASTFQALPAGLAWSPPPCTSLSLLQSTACCLRAPPPPRVFEKTPGIP